MLTIITIMRMLRYIQTADEAKYKNVLKVIHGIDPALDPTHPQQHQP